MGNSALIEKTKLKGEFKQYLTFTIGNDLYGFDVDEIREVIEFTVQIQLTRIPMVHESILGVLNLRGEVIPVIDLSMRLYGRKIDFTKRTCVVIIDIADEGGIITIGAIVNTVEGVNNFFEEDYADTPDFGVLIPLEYISRIAKKDDKITVLLKITELLRIDDLSNLAAVDADTRGSLSMKAVNEDEMAYSRDREEDAKSGQIEERHNFVTFRIDDEIYAIDIEFLNEIISITHMRKIPNSLSFMKGVINLRGMVVPVVDMRERCGLPAKEYNKNTPVIIAKLNGIQIGLIVDAFQRTIKVPVSRIQHPPHYSSKIDSDFISGLIQGDDRIIVLLDVYKILSWNELEELKTKEINKQE